MWEGQEMRLALLVLVFIKFLSTPVSANYA